MGHFIGEREQGMMKNRAVLAMRGFVTSAKLSLTGKDRTVLTLSPPQTFLRRMENPRY